MSLVSQCLNKLSATPERTEDGYGPRPSNEFLVSPNLKERIKEDRGEGQEHSTAKAALLEVLTGKKGLVRQALKEQAEDSLAGSRTFSRPKKLNTPGDPGNP